MPLGMEVGLSPGDFVLDVGTQPRPQNGRNPVNMTLQWDNNFIHVTHKLQ